MVVSAEGKFIVSGSGDNIIILWDAQEQRKSAHSQDRQARPYQSVSADGRFIVSRSENKSINLEHSQGREKCAFTGDRSKVALVL